LEEIDEISRLLIYLIRAGAGVRVIYCFIKMIDAEEVQTYKNRIKNLSKFYILAECIFQLKQIAFYYFTGNGRLGGGAIPGKF